MSERSGRGAGLVVDAGDARLAVRGTGLLRRFNVTGVLTAADLHVARRLGDLTGESDERVLLAVALAVRGVRAGSVCLHLDDRAQMVLPDVEDLAEAGPGGSSGADGVSGSVGTASPGGASGAPAAPPITEDDLPPAAQWAAALAGSPLVGTDRDGPATAVRQVGRRLYLDRYWRAEQLVRRQVDARLAALLPGVDPVRVGAAARRVFPVPDDGRQRLAAATAALSRLTVLTGGPGTGKTTAVAGLLAVLQAVADRRLKVALAAPTGKAAARLAEVLAERVAALPPADAARVGQVESSTVHRLLGHRPGSTTRFRHDAHHHLPHDVVVVDETSMVSLPLMARLLEALRPQARLVLVGDPDQLASVEAGAVLGDLVARPAPADLLPAALAEALGEDLVATDPIERAGLRGGVVRLVRDHRYGSVIGTLAAAVRAGDEDAVMALLRAGDDGVALIEPATERFGPDEVEPLRQDAERAGLALVRAARAGDVGGALAALEQHRLLLAHRRGPFGVAYWSRRVETWVETAGTGPGGGSGRAGHLAHHGPWYPGRPLLVTANDRDVGVFNGDAGVVVAAGRDGDAAPSTGPDHGRDAGGSGRTAPDPDGPGVVAAFGSPGHPVLVRPHRLPAVETVHAMTVHRAQGSQFAAVSVLLPPESSPLLTRELLYTALTRARDRVRILGTEAAVRAAVRRPVRRASGLRED